MPTTSKLLTTMGVSLYAYPAILIKALTRYSSTRQKKKSLFSRKNKAQI